MLAAALVAATVVSSLLAYVRTAERAVDVLSVNLPDPLASTGQGVMQLAYPGPLASAFDVTFALSDREGEGIWRLPREARIQVQVDTQGRALRLGLSDPGLSGEERVIAVSDREWVEFGPVPSNLAPKTVRVRTIGEGRFALLRPLEAKRPDLRQIEARVADGSKPTGAEGAPRYRILVSKPVAAREALARLFALPRMSGLMGGALTVGFAAALAGAWLVFRRPLAGILLAVAGITLVHASLRPPLHGEDETSHVGTVEFAVFAPEGLGSGTIPGSIEKLGAATDLDRVQFNALQALPLDGPDQRISVRRAVTPSLLNAARVTGAALPLAGALFVDPRAPLYYHAFPPFRPFFARLGLLDRVTAYRLYSAALGFAGFACGVLLLAWAFPERGKVLLFALAALIPPYLLSLVTTVSNYSMAIGFGQLMAASLVVAVASERHRARFVGGAVLVASTVAGLGVYRDFAGFLPAVALLATLGGPTVIAVWAWRRSGRARVLGLALATLVPAAVAWLAWRELLSRPDRVSRLVAFVLARKPLSAPPAGDPQWLFVAQVVLAPLVIGVILALFGLLGRQLGPEPATRLALARTVAGAALFFSLFLATPFRPIPIETTWLGFHDHVLAHWNAFWSSAFGFDQDPLSWKMYWGVFGWADTKYPDVVYALAKWACVALFLTLPLLCRKTQRARPWASAVLLTFAGLAVSLAVVSNTARYFIPVNPWGRFILPWVPLALFPALARIDLDPEREMVLRWLLVGAVCFHLWTAITVVGVRYFVQR